jgi:dynein heavy chain
MILETIDKTCRNAVIDLSYVLKVLQTLNLLTGILRPLVNANKTLTE